MYKYVSFKDFNPKPIAKYHKPRYSKNVPEQTVCKDFISLDTETSTDSEKTVGWIYQWCLSYPDGEDRLLVYGRRPSELSSTLCKIKEINELSNNDKLICFVHNLSYDYTYFHKFLEETMSSVGSLIAVGAHRIISYNMEGLEFRDSLKIAMKSLDGWCKDLNTVHKKLKGTIDYSITRYQDSPLTHKDWKYMFYDVICLDEAVTKQLEVHGDKIWTIPLTNTGYVRRAARKNFKKDKRNRTYFEAKKLNLRQYLMCRKEFAGGLTHGNRFYMDMTVRVEDLKKKFGRDDIIIRHRDFASHYPSQQVCGYCPSTRFIPYYDNTNEEDKNPCTKEELLNLPNQKKVFLATIKISNMKLKDGITLPVGQVSKFYEGRDTTQHFKIWEDNGRIIEMEGTSVVTVNELDLKWLDKQYSFDYEVIYVYIAQRGMFPKYLTQTVNDFFYQKSFYKDECKRLLAEGYKKDSPEYREMNLKMMIAKGMLNSIYGMSATDPVRISFYENADGSWGKDILTGEDIKDKLEDFYSKKNSFMNYELGLWTTSLARNELLEFCELIGYEYFLYADTDSIFYISTPEIEERIEQRNKEFREEDEKNGWYTTVNDKKIFFNQFEDEKENITEFRFLHSKCYAYKTDDGELHTTIAGVREYGRNNVSRVKELGDIDSLTSGKVFTYCGGTVTKYNPKGEDISPKVVNINGHLTEVSQYAIIMESTKELRSVLQDMEDTTVWSIADAV